MKEVKIFTQPLAGTDIKDAIAAAKALTSDSVDVHFNFNGTEVVVSNITDAGLLYRDYTVAHMMGWETIGPQCDYIWDSATFYQLASYKEKLETKTTPCAQ